MQTARSMNTLSKLLQLFVTLFLRATELQIVRQSKSCYRNDWKIFLWSSAIFRPVV